MTHTDIAEMIQVLRDLIEDGFTAAALAGLETLQRDVEALATQPEQAKGGEPVFLVATGEVYEGQETYTRHDIRPPLCDAEVLYTHPAPAASVSDEQIISVWNDVSVRLSGYGWHEQAIAFARAIIAMRPAQAGDQWREAVGEMFAVNHITMPEDPREAIKKLIATEVRDALDPSISSAAAALAQAGVPDDIVKDAERYRWLRATTNWASSKGERIDVRNNPELWDSAIDAAMLAAAPTKDHP